MAECEDEDNFEIENNFEIFANDISLGCGEEVSTDGKIDIIFGDNLTLSVSPPDIGIYTWTTYSGTIIGTGSFFSPEFLAENPSSYETEIYKVTRNDGLTKIIEVIIQHHETVTVYFDTDEDDDMTEIEPQEVMRGGLATIPIETDSLKKAGYYFAGWNFDFNTPIDPIEEEEIIITAIWKIQAYLVYFDTDGGTPNIIPQVVGAGQFAKEPKDTLTKAGYDFDGWDFNFTTPITKDTIVKSKWINLFVKDTIVFEYPGFVFDATMSNKHRRYFVFSPSLCEIKDTINKVIKDSIKIYIDVKEPGIVLKKQDGDPLYTKDGFHYEILFGLKNKPGLDTLTYVSYLKSNTIPRDTNIILIETPIPFDTIIGQKWNNVLFVKNNPKKFTDFEWFKNNRKVGNLQFYSAGSSAKDTLNPNDTYKVVMQTTNGIRISTCEGNPKINTTTTQQPPKSKSTLTKQVFGIKEKSLNPGSKVYNLNGKLTKETPAGVYIVKEE